MKDLICNATIMACTYCLESILPGEAYNFWFITAEGGTFEAFHTTCRAMDAGSGFDWDARIKALTTKPEADDERKGD